MNAIYRAISALTDWFIPVAEAMVGQSGYFKETEPPSDWANDHVCPGNKSKCRWVRNPSNTAKRNCSTCGAEDWLMGNPYPAINEPAYFWRRMHDPNEPEPKWMKEAD